VKNRDEKSIEQFTTDKELLQMIFDQYQKNQIVKFALKKPPRIQGIIYKTGNFFRKLKTRILIIDTTERTLVRYKRETDIPHKPVEIIPLKDIKKVRLVRDKLFFSGSYYYFQIYFETKLYFAVKTITEAEKWVHCLHQAIEFSQNFQKAVDEELIKEQEAEKIAESVVKTINIKDVQIRTLEEIREGKKKENTKLLSSKYKINLASFKTTRRLGAGKFGTVFKVGIFFNLFTIRLL